MQPSALEPIYRLYQSLAATTPFDPESGLGGKLLYAGEINPHSSHLLYAASIAGAASLAAAPDPALQRQAIRDGAIDFLVTSLEEALRILKNEIRKHQTVSVVVAIDSATLVEQMLDRGVLPDLLPPIAQDAAIAPAQAEKFLTQGAQQVIAPVSDSANFISWSVDRLPARWLPRLDTCAFELLPEADLLRRRWLRLAPRYLGQLARRERGIALSAEEKTQLKSVIESCVSKFVDEGEEPAQISILEPSSLEIYPGQI
jgi:urocanate hydratase